MSTPKFGSCEAWLPPMVEGGYSLKCSGSHASNAQHWFGASLGDGTRVVMAAEPVKDWLLRTGRRHAWELVQAENEARDMALAAIDMKYAPLIDAEKREVRERHEAKLREIVRVTGGT